ncbi:MAG: glycoside hydrolase family 92 protein [Caldithrix sp.]|nr:glycoside hydrolase family 92 protein [Caldithrix sp.]
MFRNLIKIKSLLIILVVWQYTGYTPMSIANPGEKYTQWVNPHVGTDATGHTFPGAAYPFGMIQLSPDTHNEGWNWCSGYHYSDASIMGFSHLHLSGTGAADLGDVLIMPATGPLKIRPGTRQNPDKGYRSRFRHETEQAHPGYYRVYLDDYDIKAEFTVSQRVGFHRYSFPETDNAHILIDLQHGIGWDKVIEAEIEIVDAQTIIGKRISQGWAKQQFVYFIARFSRPFETFGVITDESIRETVSQGKGQNIKAFLGFSKPSSAPIKIKVALSAVDKEGARQNLQQEIPHWDFDKIRNQTRQAWDKKLGAVEIKSDQPAIKTTFYTAMYHAMLAPYLFQDADGRYRGIDHKIHQSNAFINYTVFSLWDTFRALHPLLNLFQPVRTNHLIQSLLHRYQEGGRLPIWELMGNYTGTMIGYHAVPVIVDAYLSGINGFDVQKAYEAIKHSAMLDHLGLDDYKSKGFIAYENERESVSKTLEYAYDDWCIAQLAKALGKTEDYHYFIKRSQNYHRLFDPETGFMRPISKSGQWKKPFDPTEVNDEYTEANAWQYTFFVPHDMHGLIKLMGGSRAFSQKLQELFTHPGGLSGRHQPDITGLIGMYAQGNEPSHNYAYLFNYAGDPHQTQYWVRKLCRALYSDRPDGLCGNEDCGQLSAWYIFSVLGFYPVCPASGEYAIGSPLIDEAIMHLPSGNTFKILAENNADGHPYIQKMYLNGNVKEDFFLQYNDIIKGGELRLMMGENPAP